MRNKNINLSDNRLFDLGELPTHVNITQPMLFVCAHVIRIVLDLKVQDDESCVSNYTSLLYALYPRGDKCRSKRAPWLLHS